MKKKLLSFCGVLFMMTGVVLSQLPPAITLSPANASGKHLITITFDPSKACNSVPENQITADDTIIMMHSSAHTFSPVDLTHWGNYGIDYNGEPGGGYDTKFTKNTNGTWSKTFIPQVYYNVDPDTLITGLSIVLNTGNWPPTGHEGKDQGENGCQDFKIPLSSDTTVNTALGTTKYNTFKFQPNPVSQQLTISNQTAMKKVVISDIVGKEVLKVIVNGTNATINAGMLQKGIYILSVFDKDGLVGSEKLIKQ